MVANVPKALVIHQDEDDVRLCIELVPPIAPVLPRRLDTVRDDETEENTERDPQDQHVSGGFGAPGAARVGCAGALHMFWGRSGTWESGSRLRLQPRWVKTSPQVLVA